MPRTARRRPTRRLLRVGAVTLVSGIAVEVVMQFLHPSKADPNDSVARLPGVRPLFNLDGCPHRQFAGTLLIVLGLVALSRALSRQPRLPGALAIVGGVTAILVAAVFAVQMASTG
jgi:hypothetical protein